MKKHFSALSFLLVISFWGNVMVAQYLSEVADLKPLPDARCYVLGELDGKVIFAEGNYNSNLDSGFLYLTDSTMAGTQVLLADPFREYSNLPLLDASMFSDSQYVYFFLQNFSNWVVPELWRSDGTAAGTSMIASFGPTISPEWTFQLEQQQYLFFNPYYPSYNSDGEVWVTDGSSTGTIEVGSFNNGFLFSPHTYANGSEVFFILDDRYSGNDVELWKTDGSIAGTQQVFDFGTSETPFVPNTLMEIDSTQWLYKTRDDPPGGPLNADVFRVFISDGTTAGTKEVHVTDTLTQWIFNSPLFSTGPGANPLFIDRKVNGDLLLMSYDLALDSVLVLDTLGQATGNVTAQAFSLSNSGKALFALELDGQNDQLWVTDGTPNGSSVLLSMDELLFGSYQDSARHFFVYDDGGEATLMLTDGTSAGTSDLAVLDTLALSGGVYRIREIGNTGEFLFFSGRRYWVTDGTVPGTQFLADSDIRLRTGNEWPIFLSGSSAPGLITRSGSDICLQNITPSNSLVPLACYQGNPFSSQNQFTSYGRTDRRLVMGAENSQQIISDGTSAGTNNMGFFSILAHEPFDFGPQSSTFFFGQGPNAAGIKLYKWGAEQVVAASSPLSFSPSIQAFPNPGSQLQLQFAQRESHTLDAGACYEVYNSSGKLMARFPVEELVTVAESAAWPAGIYLIRLRSGKQMGEVKWLKVK